MTAVASVTYRQPGPGPPLRYRVKHPNGEGELDVTPEDVTLAEDDGNQLIAVPDSVGQLTSLSSLNLSDNLLRAVPDTASAA